MRAVAVLAVVFFHAFPDVVPGGFVGVDVFFVISGYLISTIILGNLAANSFRFREFYARRIKRIFPALAVVLGTSLVLGWHFLLASEYVQLGWHTVGGATFVSNLMLWRESGYFDVRAELKPLLHLWSLGIEEQFYLAWPLALWLAWRRNASASRLMLLVGLASFGLNIAQAHTNPTAAFYSPLTRFWELMLGAALAEATLAPGPLTQVLRQSLRTKFDAICNVLPRWIRRPSAADALSLFGIALIATSMFGLNKDLLFPGWWALPPTAGAVMLIAAGPNAFCNRTLLSNRQFVLVGLISYPLYLWHWPLLAFARLYEGQVPGTVERAGLVLLAFVLAWATWWLVEKPIRFGGHTRGKLMLICAAMVAVGFAGLFVVRADGFNTRFAEPLRRYANFKYDFKSDARVETCWLGREQAADVFASECIDPPGHGRPLMIVWGDSHAARLFPGLRPTVDKRLRLGQFTRDSCLPLIAAESYPTCAASNAFVLSRIRELQPRIVLLFAHWNPTLSPALIPTIRELKRAGVQQVIVIGPAPIWDPGLPKVLVGLRVLNGLPVPRRTTAGLLPYVPSLDAQMSAAIARDQQVFYFSAWRALCDRNGCLARIGNNPDDLTSWDYGHLTTPGARYLATKLAVATNNFGLDAPGSPPASTILHPVDKQRPRQSTAK